MTPTSLVAARRGPAGRLGDVRLAGRIDGGRGVPPGPPRRYPSFALTYVTAGSGRYREAGRDLPLSAGSLVHVFPGRPHWYGVSGPGGWDEVYLVFEGPIFELAARTGVLDPRQPVRTLLPVPYWLHRLDDFRTRRPPRTAAARDAEACDLLRLLTEIHGTSQPGHGALDGGRGEDWFLRSQDLLEAELDQPLRPERVAEAVGMPYETWRRRFRERAGCAPARHRLLRRVDAATELLTHTSLSTREIAATLGFSDERHLIRPFRAVTGATPRAVRDAGR